MTVTEPLIRSISETANWVAFHRATESERPDAIFHDPYARRLAGARGEAIARTLRQNAWAIAVRTYLFDRALVDLISRECLEMVVNLAAGLDARPYRLALPAPLRWVELDLPGILDEKQKVLTQERPSSQLEVIAQNLGDVTQRRELFSQLNQRAVRIAVMSEGLLLYLDEDKVSSLAADLHAQTHFGYWVVEVVSPRVLAMVMRRWRRYFEEANARMSFAPGDWRTFYRQRGWEPVDFKDMAETAREVHREPAMMKAMAFMGKLFPSWRAKQSKEWESGVAVLRRR